MIKNSKQAAVAKASLKSLEKELRDFISQVSDANDIKNKLTIDSFNSLIIDLNYEIQLYDRLLNENFHCFKNRKIEDIAEVLISSRIAQGITQKQLAELVDIKEQQIQRYELTDYEGASIVRLIEIAEALNIDLEFKDILILGKQIDFQLPSNISSEEVEIAELRIKQSKSLLFQA